MASENAQLDHVAIAVRSIKDTLKIYMDIGCQAGDSEVVPSQDVKTQFIHTGQCKIELLEPLSPEGPVGKFIQKKGPGIHHICLKVVDIETTLKNLKAKGYQLINEIPVAGAENCKVAFVHPKATEGVLIELSQA